MLSPDPCTVTRRERCLPTFCKIGPLGTREKDAHVLTLIEKAFGDRLEPSLTLADFWRWYDPAKKPKAPGQPERVRCARGHHEEAARAVRLRRCR